MLLTKARSETKANPQWDLPSFQFALSGPERHRAAVLQARVDANTYGALVAEAQAADKFIASRKFKKESLTRREELHREAEELDRRVRAATAYRVNNEEIAQVKAEIERRAAAYSAA